MTRAEIADELEQVSKASDAAYDLWEQNPGSNALWADYTSAQRIASDILRVRLPTILRALRGSDEAAVERAAKALHDGVCDDDTWDELPDSVRGYYRDQARAALRAAAGDEP